MHDIHEEPERAALRRWLLLAVASLILAGLLASSLVIARTPPFARLISDPAFFRRCLVVHVDLSLVVWLYAFIAGLLFLLPARGRSSPLSRAAVFASGGGVGLLLVAAGVHGAAPVLANYVPVIDHWLFGSGLVLFAAGVLLSLLDRRLLPGEPASLAIPPAAIPGLRATALALILAALTFGASWLSLPSGLEPKARYELAHWAGGHVLALASSLAMVSVWLILLSSLLGRPPVSRQTASFGFAALLLPWMGSPLLALGGAQDVSSRETFTLLMRYTLLPGVAFFLVASVRSLFLARRRGQLSRRSLGDPRFSGFVASAVLTLIGWVLGACIRGSTTMIPAHYHAAIGAVTVSFMAVAYPLAAFVGMPATARGQRLVRIQPWLFGFGQSVFAIGFALAGAHGMGRKLYGSEQHEKTFAEMLGMFVMGAGGLVALVAGVSFLFVIAGAWREREREKSTAWGLEAPQPGGTHV